MVEKPWQAKTSGENSSMQSQSPCPGNEESVRWEFFVVFVLVFVIWFLATGASEPTRSPTPSSRQSRPSRAWQFRRWNCSTTCWRSFSRAEDSERFHNAMPCSVPKTETVRTKGSRGQVEKNRHKMVKDGKNGKKVQKDKPNENPKSFSNVRGW